MADGSNIGADTVHAERLRSFIERIEKVREQIADLKADEEEIFAEIKGEGYMTRPIRTILKQRAEDPDKRAEEEALLDLYKSALGMA